MISISWKRVIAVGKKELYHILRDPFTIGMAIFLPAFLVLAFGYAIDFDIRDISIQIYDEDQSESSYVLKNAFFNSGYFLPTEGLLIQDATQKITQEEVKAALIIPARFEEDLKQSFESQQSSAKVQVLLDGTDNAVSGVIGTYLFGLQQSVNKEFLKGMNLEDPIKIQTRYLYNRSLESSWFIVPGLSVVVMAVLSILLTALTVAREWESGSMELLLSTPIRPLEIVLGKMTPYLFLSLLGLVFVYVTARCFFGVPFVGNHILYILGAFLFITSYLCLGLIISIITKQQQIATQMGMLVGLLPSLLFSGFVFSIENMPIFFQYFTAILPARWFMDIARGLYLKGTALGDLATPFMALVIINFVLIMVANKKLKGNLEG